MKCPFCQTENREDRETCYVCGKDISTLRLLVNKARQHYNDALEHAERDRVQPAIDELQRAVELDNSLVNAHVVLGTLHAREGRFAQARICWETALSLNPELSRAHDYLERVEGVQAALPTLKAYRRVALLLLAVTVALAAYLIFRFRPDPGETALVKANAFLASGEYTQAKTQLEQAKILAEPGTAVEVAAVSLGHSLQLDLQQRLRMVQDLKLRQLYPEALQAMAELEATGVDTETSAALAIIRDDISYYYRNMLFQLYGAYERSDVDYPTLEAEISRFLNLYPPSPERTEIQGYLERAQSLEVQASMDELRRRFALDNNVQVAVEGLRELARRFEGLPAFEAARSAFVEEILSYLFNLLTGYLDQNDFAQASALLNDIENVSTEFKEMVKVDISGAVELAWSVLKDAKRQYNFSQIEELIKNGRLEAAEDALWLALADDLTPAERGLLMSYWRQVKADEPLQRLLRSGEGRRYFDLEVSEEEASQTLQLLEDVKGRQLSRRQQIQLQGFAAAAALKLGLRDQATSLAASLRQIDKGSSITVTVNRLLRAETTTSTQETSGTNQSVNRGRGSSQ